VLGRWDARSSAQETEAPVPVHEEPRHRKVFESGAVRVLDVQIPPGDTTKFHIHATPILYVPISASVNRTQVLGAEWRGGEVRPAGAPAPVTPGRVSSITTYMEQPQTHRVNNVGQTLFRLIAVANLTIVAR
jgi:hypothetical protein